MRIKDEAANAGILLIASIGMIITALGLISGVPTGNPRPCHINPDSIACQK